MAQIDGGLINNPPLPELLEIKPYPAAGSIYHTEIGGFPVAPRSVAFKGGVPGTAAATTATAGTVKRAAAVPNSTATDVAGLVTNFNALLASLRAAGILAP